MIEQNVSWKKKNTLLLLAICIAYVVALALFWPFYFDFIEARSGTQLNDFLLELLPAKDISVVIFIALYAGVVIGLLSLIKTPESFLMAIFTYCFVTSLRIIAIYYVPLLPPHDYIPLEEPFVKLFTTDGKIISHDLFFSGHVSTILSVFFALRKGKLKWIVLMLASIVSVGVLIQHVHYTIDVLFAVPATYACFVFSRLICQKVLQKNNSHHSHV